jgi:calmodulin
MTVDASKVSEVFAFYSSSGRLPFLKFSACIRSLGLLITEKEVNEYKLNYQFPLDFQTFSKIVDHVFKAQGSKTSTDELAKAFKTFDVKGKGVVQVSDLRHFLTSLGEKLTEEEIDEAMKIAGLTDKVELSYVDFLNLVKIPADKII